jgi:quercetin dioxygenase-like cupin family protein
MSQSARPVERLMLNGQTIQFLIEGKDSNGSIAAIQARIPAGTKVPLAHSHAAFEETIYVLEGELAFTVDGDTRAMKAGDIMLIPRGAVHTFSVNVDQDASILSVATPGLFRLAYFHELAELLDGSGDEPPDPIAISTLMKRHGITPAPVAGLQPPDAVPRLSSRS